MICKPTNECELAREKLSGDLGAILELRPIPQIALEIDKACKNEQTTPAKLVELIQCEPAISSRILSVVNSPIYSLAREIDTLNQAIVVLGFKRLSELSMSLASRAIFESDSDSKAASRGIYEHSLASGTIARVLADHGSFDVDEGAAFLAGILHDVGKLFLFDLAPETYTNLCAQTPRVDWVAQEVIQFGKSHAEIGMKFAVFNGLPQSIYGAIAHHHDHEHGIGSELTEVIDLANSLSKAWGMGVQTTSLNSVAETWLESNDEPMVDQIQQTATEHFKTLKSMLMA